MNDALRRAVVIRIGALGDVLLTRRLTYSLSLAGYRSTLLAPARHASLLTTDPWLEAVLDSESPRLAPAFEGRWPAEAETFDAAVVISQSPGLVQCARSAAPVVLSGSPTPPREGVLISRQWAEISTSLAAPFDGELPDLVAASGCSGGQQATVIHSGSGSPRKNWPVERFIELGRRLQGAGHRILWIHGPAESESLGAPADFETLIEPSIDALAATLAQARLFIGNDSGVSHLAGAVGAPTLAIFGPTNPDVWRPDGARVRTMRAASGALLDLSVSSVLAAAIDLAA